MSSTPALLGQTAIVTGAARGIGAAISATLAKHGATVVAADVLEVSPDALKTKPKQKIIAAHLDVSDEQNWADVVEKTLAETSRIDILINNAGILEFATIEDTDPSVFRRMLEVNLTGSFLGMRAVIPHMKAAGSGSIVNMSSSSAVLPHNATGAYAASKFGVRGMSRAAALELGPHGIRVNCVLPGGVNTPMTNPSGLASEKFATQFKFVPQQRGCEPEEIADAVLYFAANHSAYCNGAELVVDGGMTAGIYVPGLPGSPG